MPTDSTPSEPGIRLDRPKPADLTELHAIYRDARVWTHLPTWRHADTKTTETMLRSWIAAWARDGLGPWIVRSPEGAMLGQCGCDMKIGTYWNLGYRFAPEAQGNGYATAVSRAAMSRARELRGDLPVVAYLLEHNAASQRVAEKLGMRHQHRGPDPAVADPSAIRLVYADRQLTDDQLAAALTH